MPAPSGGEHYRSPRARGPAPRRATTRPGKRVVWTTAAGRLAFRRAVVATTVTVLLAAARAGAAPAPGKPWVPVGRLDPRVVKEPSGIVKSRRHQGIYWTHGDSGTKATLFAFRESGKLVASVDLAKAPNTDWEDIAADESGNLYVGDIGNNLDIFPARYVYVLPEPSLEPGPDADAPSPVTWSKRWKFKYPQNRFNAECLFVLKDRMHIISIGHKGKPTMYRLDPVTETECEITALQTLPVWSAQGADVSQESGRLAVCTSGAVWVFEIDEKAKLSAGKKPLRVTFPRCPAEACCFDGGDVMILTEQGLLYRIPEADFQAGASYVTPPKPKKTPK